MSATVVDLMYIDHDTMNTVRPFLPVCCDDRCVTMHDVTYEYGPYPDLTQAIRVVADHQEEHGIDRYRRCPYKMTGGRLERRLSDVDYEAAWRTFEASDRMERSL